MGVGLDGASFANASESTSMGVLGSLGTDIAERLRSRSSGGKFSGCVSAAS